LAQQNATRRIHVVEVLEATMGGTRTHLLQLLEGMDRRRFRMTLVASAERDERFRGDMKRLENKGVRAIEIPMVRRIAPWRDLVALVRLCSLLRAIRPDVVHTHASKAGMLGRIAARLNGLRAILHTPHVYYFQGKRGVLRWIFRAIERRALPLTSRTILLCESQRDLAVKELRCDATRAVVIRNGVDAAHFSPRNRKREARERLGIPFEVPTVGTITRFAPQKGCDVFLKAMARVFEELPECHCVFVASGPLRSGIMRLAKRLGISGRITWRDFAADPREIYEALDLFVMSSRYAGMPYVLLEAMSMGLPAVATRVSGCADVVNPEGTGLLAEPDDPAGLARCILRLLREPERARRMGTEARKLVAREFSISRFLERTAELYCEQADV